MPRSPSPRRYAQAVFQIALESGDLDSWEEDLRVVALALESRELSSLLDAPQVPAARKLDVIRSTLGDAVVPLVLNLLSILATRNLAHLVPSILDEYDRLLDAHRGIERAEVISALQLNDAERTKIAEILEGIVGKEIRLSSIVEPSILGGLIARVGDRVIDGSVRARVRQMHRNIVEQTS